MLGNSRLPFKAFRERVLARYPLVVHAVNSMRGLPAPRRVTLYAWVLTGALASSLSPLLLSFFIQSLGETSGVSTAAVIVVGAYFVLRLVDMIMGNLRWIMVNPTLYLLSYQYASASTQKIGQSYSSRLRDGDLSASDTSKTIALVQNAQSAFMNTCYNLLCVLLPTAIATVTAVTVVFSQLGAMAFLVFLGGAAVSLFAMFWGRELEARMFSRAVEGDIAVYATIGEFVSNHQLISEFSAKGFFRAQLDAGVSQSLVQHREYFGMKCRNECIRSSFGFTTYLVVMCLAIFGVSSELRTASDIFLIFAYMDRMNGPLAEIARAVVSIRTNEASGGLLDELLAGEKSAGSAVQPGERVLDGATPEERRFIECVDRALRRQAAPASKLFRVSGESGSGKTTFLRQMKQYLHAGFGVDLDLCSLRAKVPSVRGTVGQNILLGDERISSAAAQSLLDRLLTCGTTPRRRVGLAERVDSLSGGEMQALALVRVLLRRPRLVLLDEATSAMDSELEVHALRLLHEELPESVLVVVSHRPELAMDFHHQIHMNRWGPSHPAEV